MGDRIDERRRHPRVRVAIDGRWQGTDAGSLCKMADLSLGGCFAETPSTPAVSEHMFVTLFFGGRAALLLPGRVARVEPGVGFAMEFGEMGSENRFQLSEEIARISRRRRV
jgi:hypothetical protein